MAESVLRNFRAKVRRATWSRSSSPRVCGEVVDEIAGEGGWRLFPAGQDHGEGVDRVVVGGAPGDDPQDARETIGAGDCATGALGHDRDGRCRREDRVGASCEMGLEGGHEAILHGLGAAPEAPGQRTSARSLFGRSAVRVVARKLRREVGKRLVEHQRELGSRLGGRAPSVPTSQNFSRGSRAPGATDAAGVPSPAPWPVGGGARRSAIAPSPAQFAPCPERDVGVLDQKVGDRRRRCAELFEDLVAASSPAASALPSRGRSGCARAAPSRER